MGEVLAARDVRIGREVALKRLHERAPTPVELARFLREARIQGQLEHPSIPPVHEVGYDEDGLPYFVMRRLAGKTLAQAIDDASFTRQRLLRAFVDVCHAIDLAHSRGVIHRDLKPSNILLGERGETYVLDWGIARELDVIDDSIAGTPSYMAPEQVRGDRDLDERVDVFALGRVLIQVLTKRAELDITPELEALCRAATADDREARIPSVRILGDAVQQFLDGDRDIARRRELAWWHLVNARAAWSEITDDEQRRTIVMREAGRALALDPTLGAAADLIGRVMIEPPKEPPPGVLEELASIERRDMHTLVKVSLVGSILYAVLLPLFIVLGIRDVPYAIAYGALCSVMIGTSLLALRRMSTLLNVLFTISEIAMLVLITRAFMPAAPGIAAVGLVMMSFDPAAKHRGVVIAVVLATLAALLGVLLAEQVGLLSQTVFWSDGVLGYRSPLDGFESFPVIGAMMIFVTMMIAFAGAFSYVAIRRVHQARAHLVTQAWHLRQLV
jgi:eukaryotic-like serine/threonine-protein kinase